MTNRKNWQALFYQSIIDSPLQCHLASFAKLIDSFEQMNQSKELVRWQKQLQKLPKIGEVILNIDNVVGLSAKKDTDKLDEAQKQQITAVLKNFMPWRKGPFDFFDINIDTEWRSDIKWHRVTPFLPDLTNKRVLDVGCGSGYHLFRMFKHKPEQVIGIDPTILFFYQFQCFKSYLSQANIHFLPIGIEAMPKTNAFDCVFSMGVMYHRPDPISFLKELKSQMNRQGTLIIETLIIDGDENTVLMPKDRYAKMRNVWFIPSVDACILWMNRAGFKNVECVDIDVTSFEEQRATQWMQNQSLIDFLDPNDIGLTIEGYPAPKRAIFIAKSG